MMQLREHGLSLEDIKDRLAPWASVSGVSFAMKRYAARRNIQYRVFRAPMGVRSVKRRNTLRKIRQAIILRNTERLSWEATALRVGWALSSQGSSSGVRMAVQRYCERNDIPFPGGQPRHRTLPKQHEAKKAQVTMIVMLVQEGKTWEVACKAAGWAASRQAAHQFAKRYNITQEVR
jgi:hypothetical protein